MTAIPFKSPEDRDAFLEQITKAALSWVRPIWWYDWQQPFEALKITGASCFVLKFKVRYVGLAAHVFNELRCLDDTPPLWTSACNWPRSTYSVRLSIQTMTSTSRRSPSRNSKSRDPGSSRSTLPLQWPSDIPIERDMPIHPVGLPEACGSSITRAAWSTPTYQALGLVEHVTDRDIITIYDPMQSRGSPTLLPLGFNMS
jgi:hypothetical protein